MSHEHYDLGTDERTPLSGSGSGSRGSGSPARRRAVVVVAIVLVAAAIGLGVYFGLRSKSDGVAPSSPEALASAVKVQDIFVHLEALQRIADANNGTRAVSTPENGLGFIESVQYVNKTLHENTNFNITVQTFTVPLFSEIEPATIVVNASGQAFTLSSDDGVSTAMYSDSGFVSGPLKFLDKSNDGCNMTHYVRGSVAVVETNINCTNYDKAVAAKAQGVAALIFTWKSNSAFIPRVMGPTGEIVKLRMLTIPRYLWLELQDISQGSAVELSVTTLTHIDIVDAMNVIADTQEGAEDRVVVSGSHLDSVPAGPGINDNGSGTSVNLQMALETYRLLQRGMKLVQKIRFAWWGAEELGLLGSGHYVANLKKYYPDELKKIACNLNYDMLGSPNYYRGVYNGRSSANSEANQFGERVANGSSAIQRIFEGRFNSSGLYYELSEFNGRSDYGPFIREKIPAGGLFTGAEQVKTLAQRQAYGGLAGAAYDPCYHKACDTVANVDKGVLQEMADAASFALQRLAVVEDIYKTLNDSPEE